MNIPPLISRTPPPISDVIDDEDEDNDNEEDIVPFSALNFVGVKSTDHISDGIQNQCSEVTDDNGKIVVLKFPNPNHSPLSFPDSLNHKETQQQNFRNLTECDEVQATSGDGATDSLSEVKCCDLYEDSQSDTFFVNNTHKKDVFLNVFDDVNFCYYECENSPPLKSTTCIDQEGSSQLPSDIDDDVINKNEVTSELDGKNNQLSFQDSSENAIHSIDVGVSSEVQSDFPEIQGGAFNATFPDVVQNYQLDGQTSLNSQTSDDEFSDFVECSYDVNILPEIETCHSSDPYTVFMHEFAESKIAPALLLCLRDELGKTSVWNKLSNLENTPASNYRWGNSYSSSRLLSALKIDSGNILSGHWKKSFKKLPSGDYKGSIEPIELYSDLCLNKVSIPHPQFEWVGSGLINPLDDNTGSRSKKTSHSTLSSDAEKLISTFPDLSYIKQSFIVFPKNIN